MACEDQAEDSHRLSIDLDALAKAQGFAQRADLPLAPPSTIMMGSVLGMADRADRRAIHDGPSSSDAIPDGPSSSDDDAEPQPALDPAHASAHADATAERRAERRGGYGAMVGGYGAMDKGGARVGGYNAHLRLGSWSVDSGGLREATFKKKSGSWSDLE